MRFLCDFFFYLEEDKREKKKHRSSINVRQQAYVECRHRCQEGIKGFVNRRVVPAIRCDVLADPLIQEFVGGGPVE